MRSCIFCSTNTTTKEDAWPLWLIRLLGKHPVGKMEARRGKQGVRFWDLVKPEIKVKFVCAHCNNGWMSQLENRVKPIVESLLSNEPFTLDYDDQTILAVWSLKNAMVYEALRPNRLWFFVESERRELMDTLKPIQRISVWISKCVEFSTASCYATDLNGIVGDFGTQIKAYVTTMGFGPLAIQVLGIKSLYAIPINTTLTADLRPGPWDKVTIRIWPPQQERVTWPTPVGLLGERGLTAFGERWNPTIK